MVKRDLFGCEVQEANSDVFEYEVDKGLIAMCLSVK